MMRPQSLALPPLAPTNAVLARSGNGWGVTFNDNSITETSFQLQRTDNGTTWNTVAGTGDVGTLVSPLDQPNTTATGLVLTDSSVSSTAVYKYRVAAVNTVGYGSEFPSMNVQSVSATLNTVANPTAPAAPTNLAATLATTQINLTWRDNATDENGFYILRSTNGGAFVQIATAPPRNNTGNVNWTDATVTPGNTYSYQVAAFNGAGSSTAAGPTASLTVTTLPATPTGVTAANGTAGGRVTAGLNWDPVTGATSYSIRWSTSPTLTPVTLVNGVTSGQQINMPNTVKAGTKVYMQVRANNAVGSSAWAPTIAPVTVIAQ